MIGMYKTIDGKIQQIDKIEDGCWINLIAPSEDEVNSIIDALYVEPSFLKAALDDEESSRIENEDNQTLIIIDVPMVEHENKALMFSTLPLGIIITEKNIITVCLKENSVIKEFSNGIIKSVFTHMKTRFILQILFRVASRYLQYLKQIDRISNQIEKQLHKSMKNKELIQLLDLEKSLLFFSTSLKANEVTMEKLLRGRAIKLYDEDQDLLEDVIIENKQAIEMSNIYSGILSGTMDAFASIISNNLNIVMKFLASITIVLAVPTMIASYFGMNVKMPFSGDSHFAFFGIIIFSVVVTSLVTYALVRRKMF